MAKRYRLTLNAEDDLITIFVDGLTRFGLDQANAYNDGLYATFAFLAEYPRAARSRKEIDPPVRAHRYQSHLVIYELGSDNQVIILRIRHGREDWLARGH